MIAGGPAVIWMRKFGVGWKYPTLALKVPIPRCPFRTRSHVALPSAPVRRIPPAGTLQVAFVELFEPPLMLTLTLGIGSPVIEVTSTTTAPVNVVPACP